MPRAKKKTKQPDTNGGFINVAVIVVWTVGLVAVASGERSHAKMRGCAPQRPHRRDAGAVGGDVAAWR